MHEKTKTNVLNDLSDQQIASLVKSKILSNDQLKEKSSTKIKSIYENANEIQRGLIDEAFQALSGVSLNEILQPALVTTQRFSLMNKNTEFKGSSGASEYLTLQPSRLIQVFGEPEESDGYKVSGEYRFNTPNGGMITLYDWKSTSLYDSNLIDPVDFWGGSEYFEMNLGGDDEGKKHVREFMEWIQGQLENSVRFIVND
jgi:hypothetical protein